MKVLHHAFWALIAGTFGVAFMNLTLTNPPVDPVAFVLSLGIGVVGSVVCVNQIVCACRTLVRNDRW